MYESPDLPIRRIQLKHGAGQIPGLGFGTFIPDTALAMLCSLFRLC